MTNNDITEQPYSEWLEDALHDLVELRPVTIGIALILPDGSTATRYYNADSRDLTIMRESFQLDWLSRVLEANADKIKELLNGEENEHDET